MTTHGLARWATVVLASVAAGSAGALTTAGSGTAIVVPIVAQTGSYSTEVFVRNANSVAITVNVKFYEANTSSNPGLRPCANLAVPANRTVTFSLSVQCFPLGAGSHHGMLILEDAAAEKVNPFVVYSRSQTPGGNGFSVEGFPVGNFSGAPAGVIGLKRQAAAPVYQTNCFIGALGEPVDYQVQLFNEQTGAQVGSNITGSLLPYQMVRLLDVYAAAGVAAGDQVNTRARFDDTSPGEPAFVAFCTVQESTFFGADFRIAKSGDAHDNRQRREVCYSQDPCGTADGQTQITDVTRKSIHYFLIAQPDYVRCQLVSPRLADLEIQLRGPGDPFAAPVFATSPPYSSGGEGQTSFYVFTGHRDAVNSGFTTRWYIDVSFREGANSTLPIPYGITCNSGNGVSVPWFRGTDLDNF